MQIMRPAILIVTDEDHLYGINHNFYPQFEDPIKYNQIKVVSNQEIDEQIIGELTHDGKDFFILNPYINMYVKTSLKDLVNIFIQSKSQAVKEALVKMGAKIVKVKDKIKDVDRVRGKMEGRVSVMEVKGSINTSYDKTQSFDIESMIESSDPNRKPKPYTEVKSYVDTHGLNNDTGLRPLLERLEQDGILSGTEKYEFKCLQEIDTAIKILSSLDCKFFNSSLDFSEEHYQIHEITKELLIEF